MMGRISMDAEATRRSDRRRTIGTSRIGIAEHPVRTTQATRAGAKSGPSCGEDLVGVENIIRVKKLFNLFHRQHRLIFYATTFL